MICAPHYCLVSRAYAAPDPPPEGVAGNWPGRFASRSFSLSDGAVLHD